MTRRERLLASVFGQPVDRPPVSFYELNSLNDVPDPSDPFNIYTHPSWRPLLELTREKSDCIAFGWTGWKDSPPDANAEFITRETKIDENGNKHFHTKIRAGNRTLTSHEVQEPDVNTVWTVEHLCKDIDDFKAYLDLPETPFGGEPDLTPLIEFEKQMGDRGIVMLGYGDPICHVAPLFDLGTFTVIALTEQELMHRALDRFARSIYPRVEAIAKAAPGRLWRVVGPEYISPPYLPPRFFREYMTAYDRPIVESIQKYGGVARIHSHGRLRDIIEFIAETGCQGLDPVEPPPQGDVELGWVREKYGQQMTLFGNIEIADLENLPTDVFAEKVRRALREGTQGTGRGFVLMPSSCPYGRVLADLTLRNYEKMVELAENFAG